MYLYIYKYILFFCCFKKTKKCVSAKLMGKPVGKAEEGALAPCGLTQGGELHRCNGGGASGGTGKATKASGGGHQGGDCGEE